MLRILTLALCCALVSCGFNKGAELNNKALTGIIGGTDVTEKNPLASGIVGIFDKDSNSICTGSIISEEYILTAAHCAMTHPSNLSLKFGVDVDELLGAREQDIIQTYTRQVVALEVHDKYNHEDDETEFNLYDVAILKFNGGLPPGYKAVPLLANDGFLRRGTVIKIAGYGVNSVVTDEVNPRKVKNLKEKLETGEVICDDDMKHCLSVEMTGDGLLRETMVTISSLQETEFRTKENEGHGSCAGDSGGPAYVEKDGVWYLLGVTSRGDALCDNSGVYSNVATFGPWIQATVKALALKGRR